LCSLQPLSQELGQTLPLSGCGFQALHKPGWLKPHTAEASYTNGVQTYPLNTVGFWKWHTPQA
jgi:hypothetical protein